NGFTVAAGTPVLQTVNPGSGQQGRQNLSMNLTGQFTHFVQGTTTASFGAGITVVSMTFDSATTPTTVVNIVASTATGNRHVTLTFPTLRSSDLNGFTVAAGTPVLQTVNPGSGQQGRQNLSMNLTGQFTHFVQGTTTASFGAGITVVSLTVNSATTATTKIRRDAGRDRGNHNVVEERG